MRKQIQQQKCDQCGKIVEYSEMTFGGSPVHGWIKIQREDHANGVSRSRDQGPWDVCSYECAIQLLKARGGLDREHRDRWYCFGCGKDTERKNGACVICAGKQVSASAGCLNLNDLAQVVHKANIKWWQNIDTGALINRNRGELIALMHSELSEALEGERKDLMDDKLHHRKCAEVELVDTIIRILDYAAGFGYDLQGAFDEKMVFNFTREDHTHEARRIAGGKQF